MELVREDIQFSEVNAAFAGRFAPTEQFNVNEWNRDDGNGNIGALSAVVSSIKGSLSWWILTIHQAFCLFLVILFEVLSNVYFVMLENPY